MVFLPGTRVAFVVTETLTSKILDSLTDAKIEDVICASSLCASE